MQGSRRRDRLCLFVLLPTQAKEGELAIINQLLEDPKLTSKKLREMKQWHHELFLDICEFSSGNNGAADLSPLAAPLMTHTHSFIETHV